MIDAIWVDDIDTLRALLRNHPQSIHEMARRRRPATGDHRCPMPRTWVGTGSSKCGCVAIRAEMGFGELTVWLEGEAAPWWTGSRPSSPTPPKGLPHDHATDPRPGSATPPPSSPESTAPSHARAHQAGCSRQTVYDHARQVEQRLQTPDSRQRRRPKSPSSLTTAPSPSTNTPSGALAVTAFAMGISTPPDRRPAPRLCSERMAPITRPSLAGSPRPHRRPNPSSRPLMRPVFPWSRPWRSTRSFFGGGRPWLGSSPPA